MKALRKPSPPQDDPNDKVPYNSKLKTPRNYKVDCLFKEGVSDAMARFF